MEEKTDKEKIFEMLDKLSDDERLEIFDKYCKYCGTKDILCYCVPHYDQ